MDKNIYLAKKILESSGYTVESTRNSAPPSNYFSLLKNKLKSILGVNASTWVNVTTRAGHFSPEDVSVEVDRRKVQRQDYENLKSKVKEKESELSSAGIKVDYDFPYTFVVHIPISVVEDMLTQQEPKESKEKSITYWTVSVGDGGRSTYYGVGADLPGFDRANLSRIADRLGQKKFTHYYSKGPTKRFRSYNALKKYLLSVNVDNIPTEERLIQVSQDDSHIVVENR